MRRFGMISVCLLALVFTVGPVPASQAPARGKAVPAHAAVPAPARRRVDVSLPLSVSVPKELVPNKPGSMDKVTGPFAAVLPAGPLDPITAVAYSADGKRLFVGSYGRVSVWDLGAGKVTGHLGGIDGAVHDIELSPDGKRLGVSGGKPALAGSVWIFDEGHPEKPAAHLDGHTDVIYDFAWSPNGKRIATAGFDKQVKIWDVETGKPIANISDHSDFVYGVAFSPDGTLLASGSRDRSVKLWSADTGKAVRSFSGNESEVYAVEFSPDGKHVLSTGADPRIRWWNVQDGTTAREVGGHGGEVYEVRTSADRKQLTTTGSDGTVRLWNAAGGGLEKTLQAPGEALLSAALSPDGKQAAAGASTGLLRVWDVASGTQILVGFEPSGVPTEQWALSCPSTGAISVSPDLLKQIRWTVGGQTLPNEPFTTALVKPDEVGKAARGEKTTRLSIPTPSPTPGK